MPNPEPDLKALLWQRRPGSHIRRRFPPEVAAARAKEQTRRQGAAQTMAKTALTHLHPEDFRSLYTQARDLVDAESGPLPGDPDFNHDPEDSQ